MTYKERVEGILKDFELWRTKMVDGTPVKKDKWKDYEREQYQPKQATQEILHLIEEAEREARIDEANYLWEKTKGFYLAEDDINKLRQRIGEPNKAVAERIRELKDK